MLEIIIFCLLSVLYLILLELSLNALFGWFVTAFIIVVFFFTRNKYKKEKLWNLKNAAVTWGIVIVLAAGNYFLTEPPTAATSAVNLSNPEKTENVKVATGELRGVYNLDKSVEVYAGIPYAKPPVGELRWKEPEEPDSWDGVLTCDHFAPMAMQNNSPPLINSLYHIFGWHDFEISLYDNYVEPVSEDCLYLNIWKPADSEGKKLPVLFYIHGGSLTDGKSYDDRYRGEAVAKKDVIMVTVGYRLGVFGYLATEELAAESSNGTTGNYGLLDQIAALKWVHENIAAFDGDPDRITIAGESAGASSVNAICVSPLSEGLFNRAIAESSSILARFPYHTFRSSEDALSMGRDIMEEMGAADMAAMRALPAEKLIRTKHKNNAMMIDGYAIAEEPYKTYEDGNNHETALLHGFNGSEGDYFLTDQVATRDNYVELMREILGDYAEEAAEVVPWDSYPQENKLLIDRGGEAKGALCRVYSAGWFTYSHYLWTAHTTADHIPVYEYIFTKKNGSLGDLHGGELAYAYGNLKDNPSLYDEGDLALSDTMLSYWTNFVKTGDPNTSGDPSADKAQNLPEWKPCENTTSDILELGDEIRMTADPYAPLYPLFDMYQSELKE